MPLSPRQRDMLNAIEQADKRKPDRRFIYAPTGAITTRVQHPGLLSGAMTMRDQDVEKLAEDGYIQLLEENTYFVLTPKTPEE